MLRRLNKELIQLKSEKDIPFFFTTNIHNTSIEETIGKSKGESLNIYALITLAGSYHILKLEWLIFNDISKNYPFAPPDLYFLTDNPFTITNTKVCNNMTKYHATNWSPAYNIQQLLKTFTIFYCEGLDDFTFVGSSNKSRDELKIKLEEFKDNKKINLNLIEVIFPEVYKYLKNDLTFDMSTINFFNL